jgi:hypothetical protein
VELDCTEKLGVFLEKKIKFVLGCTPRGKIRFSIGSIVVESGFRTFTGTLLGIVDSIMVCEHKLAQR